MNVRIALKYIISRIFYIDDVITLTDSNNVLHLITTSKKHRGDIGLCEIQNGRIKKKIKSIIRILKKKSIRLDNILVYVVDEKLVFVNTNFLDIVNPDNIPTSLTIGFIKYSIEFKDTVVIAPRLINKLLDELKDRKIKKFISYLSDDEKLLLELTN